MMKYYVCLYKKYDLLYKLKKDYRIICLARASRNKVSDAMP